MRRDWAQARARLRQVLDREGDLAERWHVTALPAVFLVDPQGMVGEAYPAWPTDTRAAPRSRTVREFPKLVHSAA